MKCPHCHCEWNMPQGMSLSGKNCPFCGKPLVEPVVQKSDAMEDVLAAILAEHGQDCLKNGKLVLSLYKDMAPKRKRDQKLLAYFVEADGPSVLFSAMSVSAADQPTYLQRVAYKMINDLIIAESPSYSVCQLYWKVLSGNTVELAPQKSGTSTAAVTPTPKPADVVTPVTPTPKPADPQPAGGTDADTGWDYGAAVAALNDVLSGIRDAADSGSQNQGGNSGSTSTPAAGAVCHDNDYEISGDTLVKYKGSDSRIRVPDRVKTVGQSAFEGNHHLTHVYLPDSVTAIGDNAFANCTALEEVSIPGGVQTIGAFAFESCQKLRRITLPAGLKELDMGAFVDCTALEEMTVPGGVERIGGMTFSGCAAMKRATLKPGVKTISSTAFSGCTSLEQIALPDSLETVASNAFAKCNQVKVVPSGTWANPKERRFASTPRLKY